MDQDEQRAAVHLLLLFHQGNLLLVGLEVLDDHDASDRVALVHQFALNQVGLVLIADIVVDIALGQIELFLIVQQFSIGQRLLRVAIDQRLIDTGIGQEDIARGHTVQTVGLLHHRHTLTEGRDVMLLELDDGLDGIGIGLGTIVTGGVLVFLDMSLDLIDPSLRLLEVVVQLGMGQSQIDEGQSVGLVFRAFDLFGRLLEFLHGPRDITTGAVHVAHHVRNEIALLGGLLLGPQLLAHLAGNEIGIADVHTTKVEHSPTDPGLIDGIHVFLLERMFMKITTGAVEHIRIVLSAGFPHGHLEPSVFGRIFTERSLCR